MIPWPKIAAAAARNMAPFLLASLPLAAQAGEQKVTIDSVPAPVKQAILDKVGSGRLVDIGVYTADGKAVYEIEMVVDGKEYDVLFDATGKVLRTTFEGEAPAGKEGAQEEQADAEERAAVGAPTRHQADFVLEDRKLTTTGRSRYFVLEPGYQLVLEGKEGEKRISLTITVLDETRRIGSFETRVVEERETVNDALVEISRNFFAMCTETKSVFYFGEEVDIYKGGNVVSHEGAWLHGQSGARAGMMIPGEPIVGAAYYQELAPGVAMDRARVAATDVTLATPAGSFRNCLQVQEENPLDGEKEHKIHAPGIGLVQDEDLVLVKHGFVVR
jgi:hypothetical protein